MGLTIHYDLHAAKAKSKEEARLLVKKLHARAKELPFQEIGNIFEAEGDQADFEKVGKDHPNRWLLIQCGNYVDHGQRSYKVPPGWLIAFETYPGEGSEPANFGLTLPPKTFKVDGKNVRTKLEAFTWGSFCKTQYASNPKYGGVANFLKCHLSIVALLDYAKEIGILREVSDEGQFWEKRDVKALAENVGEWNNMIASVFGQLKDSFGVDQLVGAIQSFQNFEHLEAAGASKRP